MNNEQTLNDDNSKKDEVKEPSAKWKLLNMN
jgi:hypothetical protein